MRIRFLSHVLPELGAGAGHAGAEVERAQAVRELRAVGEALVDALVLGELAALGLGLLDRERVHLLGAAELGEEQLEQAEVAVLHRGRDRLGEPLAEQLAARRR